MKSSFPFQIKGVLNAHQVELMKEHDVWEGGYTTQLKEFRKILNDFGPAVVNTIIFLLESSVSILCSFLDTSSHLHMTLRI